MTVVLIQRQPVLNGASTWSGARQRSMQYDEDGD